MPAHLFRLKQKAFVLWRPYRSHPAPKLVVGRFQPGNPPALADRKELALTQHPAHADLWSIDAARCGLADGQTYHYWFEVSDSSPARDGARILCTDPIALTVDWRLLAPRMPPPHSADDQDPASVVKFANGELVPCDAAGETSIRHRAIRDDTAAANNRMVIYELPTSWARINVARRSADRRRHLSRRAGARRRKARQRRTSPACRRSRTAGAIWSELGINALELLPLADSFVEREWGYATSNYFAPDHDLGFPQGHSSPTANADLVRARRAVPRARHPLHHRRGDGLRHARGAGERQLRRLPHRRGAEPNDPDAQQSGGQGRREGFGGTLWRYSRAVDRLRSGDGDAGRFCARAPVDEGVSAALDGRLRHRRHPHGQRQQRRQLGLRAGVQGPRAQHAGQRRRRLLRTASSSSAKSCRCRWRC